VDSSKNILKCNCNTGYNPVGIDCVSKCESLGDDYCGNGKCYIKQGFGTPSCSCDDPTVEGYKIISTPSPRIDSSNISSAQQPYCQNELDIPTVHFMFNEVDGVTGDISASYSGIADKITMHGSADIFECNQSRSLFIKGDGDSYASIKSSPDINPTVKIDGETKSNGAFSISFIVARQGELKGEQILVKREGQFALRIVSKGTYDTIDFAIGSTSYPYSFWFPTAINIPKEANVLRVLFGYGDQGVLVKLEGYKADLNSKIDKSFSWKDSFNVPSPLNILQQNSSPLVLGYSPDSSDINPSLMFNDFRFYKTGLQDFPTDTSYYFEGDSILHS